MKNYLILTLLAAVLTFFLPFSIQAAGAVTYDLKDQASCSTVLGTWSLATSTCTVSSLTLNPGDLLAIDDSVFPNISLQITQSINNAGTVSNAGNIIISSSAVFDNNGSLANYCTGTCVGGTIQNNGIITNEKKSTLDTNSTINNSGPINNYGTIIVLKGGTIANGAKIINNFGGTLNNSGTIHDSQLSAIINNGGIIINYATLIGDESSTITNSGTLTNMCGAMFTNNGDLLGTPVNSTTCATAKGTSTVPEFPMATPVLVIGLLSVIVFYKRKAKT